MDEQSRPVYQKDKFNSRVKMPTNTFKFIQFLILFIALFEPNTCAVVKPQSNGEQPLNSEASQTDDRFLLDKFDKYKRVDKAHQLDRLKADEQSLSSGFVPFELNENTEENTKNVVLWTPENCKFAFRVELFNACAIRSFGVNVIITTRARRFSGACGLSAFRRHDALIRRLLATIQTWLFVTIRP